MPDRDGDLQRAAASAGARAQEIAKLNVYCDGRLVQQSPLYADSTVEEGDLVRRAADAAKHLLLGWLP